MNLTRPHTRVCHFTSVHAYNDIRIFFKECRSLASAGYEVHLIAHQAPDIELNGVYLHSVLVPMGWRFLRFTVGAWRVYLKALEVNASIYHFHDPELLPFGLLLKWHGKQVIYDTHEDMPRDILSKEWLSRPLRKIASWLFEKLENFVASRLDAVVAATPHIATRFISINQQTININNYPLSEEFADCSRGVVKQRAVCYAGGLTQIRCLFQMVEAIALTDVTLLLAGGFGSQTDKMKVMSMPGWRQTKLFGKVGRDALPDIFSQSIAGLVLFLPVPNHVNAQPNKIFEYMSAGIPVIGSDFPLWREIIEGNKCGICVKPLDVLAISQAILWLADHPEEARCMGEKGRNAVRNKYNWDAEAVRLIQLYKGIEKCAA